MTDFHIIIGGEQGHGFDCASALRYASLAGIRFAGLVMQSDGTNFSRIAEFSKQVRRLSLYANVEAWMGVELCHMPPALLPDAVREAREAGAALVLVYGESITDQVEQGTNFAAIEAGADVVTHPGLIDAEAAAFAAEKGVALEFTSCPRHALANAHTAAMALRHGGPLVRGSGSCRAEELTTRAFWPMIIKGADCFSVGKNAPNLPEHIRKSEEALIRRLMRP
ncbi:MAG: histidinol phosphate phosphatase domain-containing protein [Mailhella sp.]|nr:histidinol phosphate phosphatase domain-containing protein [Mailhella sp.]